MGEYLQFSHGERFPTAAWMCLIPPWLKRRARAPLRIFLSWGRGEYYLLARCTVREKDALEGETRLMSRVAVFVSSAPRKVWKSRPRARKCWTRSDGSHGIDGRTAGWCGLCVCVRMADICCFLLGSFSSRTNRSWAPQESWRYLLRHELGIPQQAPRQTTAKDRFTDWPKPQKLVIVACL